MKHENLLLDNQLCFALYSATNAITRAYRTQLAKFNLTYPQYLVMLALWDLKECPIVDLSKRLNIDSGTLTPLLKRMEVAGLIARKRDEVDERRMLVKLTPSAVRMREKLAPVQSNVACSTGLSNNEFTFLRDSLHRLAGQISSQYPPSRVRET